MRSGSSVRGLSEVITTTSLSRAATIPINGGANGAVSGNISNSGNVVLSSDHTAAAIKQELEDALPRTFKLDSELIAVLVLTRAQLRAVVRDRPKGFGDQPETYNSDAVFLMGIDAPTAMKVFDPRPGVDEVWPGKGVIYSQRLTAQRTKSRLGKIVGTPAYKSMTIRSWTTTLALLERMEAPEP